MKKIIFLVFCLGGFALFANPYESTIQELQSVFKHPQLQKALNHEAIMQVNKTEKGFKILSENHAVEVNVVYGPGSRFGRTDFSVFFVEGKEVSNASVSKSPELEEVK